MSDPITFLWCVIMVCLTAFVCTGMVCAAWRDIAKARDANDKRMLDMDEQEMRDQRDQWRGGDS